jgi:hypothetical protein
MCKVDAYVQSPIRCLLRLPNRTVHVPRKPTGSPLKDVRILRILSKGECQELAYSKFAESSQGLLLWLDQSFALYLSHPSIVIIIIVVPPITACTSSYDYQLLPQTHNLDKGF